MAKGYLVLIGGGEDTSLVYNKVIELAGGKDNARIAIIPAAGSQTKSTMGGYADYFIQELGLPEKNIWFVPLSLTSKESVAVENEKIWNDNNIGQDYAEKIRNFNVVVLVGGGQRRYIDALISKNTKSPFLKAIYDIFENNGVIVGINTGNDILCSTYIGSGKSEEALTDKLVYNESEDDGQKLLLFKGMGLLDNIITDTHCSQRGRLGRLIESAIITKNKYGFGISERTALVYYPDSTIEILGYGNVFVVDMTKASLLNQPDQPMHILNILVHLFSHGDKFNVLNGKFDPYPLKEDIINTPYFDAADYHVSLNVFKEYETSNIIINYMLDNEAKDVIALMDYNRQYTSGDNSYFIRFVENQNTKSLFCKTSIDETGDNIDFYSGTNVQVNVIPLLYSNADKKAKGFQSIIYGSDNNLIIVVYDDKESLPVCDAKVQIFNKDNKLVFKSGTDRFGKAEAKNLLANGEGYYLKVSFDYGILTKKFIFSKNMTGICLR